jgi:hypothetical protein
VEGGTTPSYATPPDLAGAQRQLTVLQWVIPGLTGTALVLNALMGEQQRPQQVTSGLLQGLRSRLPVLAPGRYGPGGRRTEEGQANQLSHDVTARFRVMRRPPRGLVQ